MGVKKQIKIWGCIKLKPTRFPTTIIFESKTKGCRVYLKNLSK